MYPLKLPDYTPIMAFCMFTGGYDIRWSTSALAPRATSWCCASVKPFAGGISTRESGDCAAENGDLSREN